MYYFIVNTSGGGGRALRTWKMVKKILQKRGVDYRAFFTERKGHASLLAKDVCAHYAPCNVCVVGGDGTINEVLNGLYAFKSEDGRCGFDSVRFGVIPTGSGNDFARGAKIPRNTKKALSRLLSSSHETKMDIGLARLENGSERVFGISAGLGMDAIVCREVGTSKLKGILNKLHLGNLVYVLLTIKTLFSMQTSQVHIQSGVNSYTFNRLIFLSAMNFRQEGGGVPIAPAASAFDKELSFCLASDISKPKAFFNLPFLVLAKHQGRKGFFLWNAPEITVSATPPAVLHTDGEYGGTVSSVRFVCLPAALSLLL